ncbi:DUF5652 family protein [Patescibacteria group bacterium]
MFDSISNFLIIPELKNQSFWLLFLILLWVMPWKGVALWKAAKNGHKKWFIALFLVNTLAILEILYIFIFSRKKTNSKV